MQTMTIAVSGASGKLGRMVLRELARLTDRPVLALSRTPEPFGTTGRYADFDRPESLAGAFAGVTRLVLISTDALGGDGRRVRQHRDAIDAARAAGVRHIVYTSILHATTSPLSSMVADHAETERALTASGLGHTVLRNAFYDDLASGIIGRAVEGDGRRGRLRRAAGAEYHRARGHRHAGARGNGGAAGGGGQRSGTG